MDKLRRKGGHDSVRLVWAINHGGDEVGPVPERAREAVKRDAAQREAV